MRNALIRILQALVIVAVASSLAHADDFMYFKKKAAAGGGGAEGGGSLLTGGMESFGDGTGTFNTPEMSLVDPATSVIDTYSTDTGTGWPPDGSHSLKMPYSADALGTHRVIADLGSLQDDLSVKFWLRTPAISSGYPSSYVGELSWGSEFYTNGAGGCIMYLTNNTPNILRMTFYGYGGGTSVDVPTSGSFSPSTKYKIKISYVKSDSCTISIWTDDEVTEFAEGSWTVATNTDQRRYVVFVTPQQSDWGTYYIDGLTYSATP